MAIDFYEPTIEHMLELRDRMALDDQQEILAQGHGIMEAVRSSVKGSKECVAIFVDGKLACITGLIVDDSLTEGVYPWLLGTETMQQHPRLVIKYTRQLLQRWLAEHPEMSNFVDARHTRAIRWLKYFGAELELFPIYGLYSRPFYKFTFRR